LECLEGFLGYCRLIFESFLGELKGSYVLFGGGVRLTFTGFLKILLKHLVSGSGFLLALAIGIDLGRNSSLAASGSSLGASGELISLP